MTSKAASQEHGIGLNNVKQIVEEIMERCTLRQKLICSVQKSCYIYNIFFIFVNKIHYFLQF